MTCGIEAGEEKPKTTSMLRVTEMKTLRSILGKTRGDRPAGDSSQRRSPKRRKDSWQLTSQEPPKRPNYQIDRSN